MNVELTKGAKKAIATVYKRYLDRIAYGENKKQAAFFDNEKSDHAELINSVQNDIQELKKVGFVKIGITGCVELQDAAIVYMENLAPETIKEWLSLIANFIP